MPLLQASAFGLSCFVSQNQFLPAAQLELLAQLLIGPGLGAILLKPLTRRQKFLFHDPAAFLPFLHIVQFSAGLFDAGVEQGHSGQFINEAAAVPVAHRHDAGHIALHHHVASFRIDAEPSQLGLELLQVARDSVGAVAAAVGAARHHP